MAKPKQLEPRLKEPIKIGEDRWITRIQLDWLPLPAEAMAKLGWQEGDEIELFPTHNQVVLRKKGALSDLPPETRPTIGVVHDKQGGETQGSTKR